MWPYDLDFRIKVACPKCGSLDHYTRYADYERCELRCNSCNHNFCRKQGAPDPRVKDLVDQLRIKCKEVYEE